MTNDYDFDIIQLALNIGVLRRYAIYRERSNIVEILDNDVEVIGELDDASTDGEGGVGVYLHICTLCKWEEPATTRWEACYDHLWGKHPELETLKVLRT